jgi:ribosome maturation factor RimP
VGSCARFFFEIAILTLLNGFVITTDDQKRGYLDTLHDTLWELGEKACGLFGLSLIELEVNRGRGRLLVRYYIDREGGEGGVTVEDCARVSQAVGRFLDAKDPIDGPYTLEVSSPGLERPLRKEGDFQLFAGRDVKIKTEVPIEGQTSFSGRLLGIIDGSVVVMGEDDTEYRIPHATIKKARLIDRDIPKKG